MRKSAVATWVRRFVWVSGGLACALVAVALGFVSSGCGDHRRRAAAGGDDSSVDVAAALRELDTAAPGNSMPATTVTPAATAGGGLPPLAGMSNSVRGGTYSFTYVLPHHSLRASVVPTSGSVDLMIFGRRAGKWALLQGPTNSSRNVYRWCVPRPLPAAEDLVAIAVCGVYSGMSGFRLEWAWSDGSGLMVTSVPYMKQPNSYSCASASGAMDLATFGRIAQTPAALSAAQQAIFNETSNSAVGLIGRDLFVSALQKRGLSGSFKTGSVSTLFASVVAEIDAGRPVVLGSKRFTGAGHYVVVRGYRGLQAASAQVVVNDPFGRWSGTSYDTTASGESLLYSWSACATPLTTDAPTNGIYVASP